MELVRYVKERNWPVVFGYLFFIGMMATGYYYNITFVQLGLFDLGTRLIGMSEQAVATSIACFALFTSIIALVFGLLMQKRGWSQQLILKLRLAFGIVLIQTMLTGLAPFIRSEWLFFVWVVVTSSTIGIGVPVTFSLAVDLIPVRDRGYVAGAITALAYFGPAVYVDYAWQSPQVGTLLLIGITHVVAALIAGALYSALDVKGLFLWVFGIFGLVQLMYVFDTRLTPGDAAPLVMPMLYATAVSLYIVVNFALWADLSTPRTISRNAALGVALSGWTATFISKALAIGWRLGGVPLDEHLNYVASLAIVFLLVTLAVSLVQAWGKGRKP